MKKKLIQFKNIVKEFDGKLVLKGVNLDIYENEFVTLLGPSGCGKTTLLRILGGFLTPNEGTVLFDGEDISKIPPYKREINTVFQKYALFPHMNVYNNIAFGLKIKKEPKDIIEQKVKRMLKLVNLEDFADKNVTEMSGGQQQRVAIARALVNEPSVLLLDEPLGALDLKLRQEMQHELKKIQQEVGITFIFVTHDQEEALTMSDKIVVMKDGEIQQIGSPTDIYNEPVNEFVANFIGESNIIEGVMLDDYKVMFEGRKFDCVDDGFEKNEVVDVVIRPEDLDIVPREQGKLKGVVKSVLFKGVHYETMVETNIKTSAVAPRNMPVIEAGYPTMPHITGMMTQNVLGTPVPPFIIVSDLRRLPDELKELVFAQLIWVGSSTNGYMTRDLFLLWTINFINWLSHYRLGLPSHIRDERALLLLDGHTSRECPLALLLMRRANIDVVVFPSHCTHVMQLFDVVIASPLKSRFSSCFRKVLLAKQEENDSLPEDQRLSNAAVFRYSAVWAFVDCYRSTATTLTCMSGARKTGIYPFNPNEVTSSPFVRDLTPEEQQVVDLRNQRNVNRLSISCKLITDANCIVEISNSVGRNPKFAHLCLQQQYLNMSYTALVGAILSSPRNNGRLLSPLPPFYRKNAEPLITCKFSFNFT